MTSITILERLLTPWCSCEPDPDAPVPPEDYADGPVPVPMTAVIRPDWGSPSHIRAVMTALDRVNPFYAAMCRRRQSDAHQTYESWLASNLDRLREDITRGALVGQSAVVFRSEDGDMAQPSLFMDDALLTCAIVLGTHRHPLVSISGGQDSDVMLDIISRSGHIDKCSFLFVNTGLEYKATTDHLDYLEERYRIHIDRVRQAVPVPRAVRNYGIPIISKYVSDRIHRLQNNRFDWSDDRPYDALLKDYPTCKEGLKWWTDYYHKLDNGSPSAFSIKRFKGLKEYLMLSPPTFKVSNMCCDKSKKRQFHDAIASYDCDLNVMGVRRQEGGIRATIKTCYSKGSDGIDTYRPIFWLSNGDKTAYCAANGIVHSDCYSKWGFRRTGCTGCPYNPNYRADIAIVAHYEPRMAHQAECTFGKAYEWQDGYREYRQEIARKERADKRGMRMLDEWYQ